MDNNVPIYVFELAEGNIERIVAGERGGTIISTPKAGSAAGAAGAARPKSQQEAGSAAGAAGAARPENQGAVR